MNNPPNYLKDFETLWKKDPHEANLKWFEQARFGLFIHYGLYSALGAGEWVQFHRKIPVAEYAGLKKDFRADHFDADFITDLALDAGMKYVTLVTCHHDSFCLWDSKAEPFNSVNAPCGRDLVREMAEQCDRKGLGFFAYYTFMLNWKHPYFLSRDHFPMARPDYPDRQPEYKFRSLADYPRYIDYMLACMQELLQLKHPLAGVWLDIISAYYSAPELVPVQQTYELIRRSRPEALIAYKQGATGDEDFASPEFSFKSQGESFRSQGNMEAAARADRAWELNREKHNEICMTLQKGGWGYQQDAIHLSADELLNGLGIALSHNCNLLANIGPLPDGSIHPEDIKTLRETGKRIRSEGWPTAVDSPSSSARTGTTDAGAE